MSNNYKPVEGDRVRVVLEGSVVMVGETSGTFWIGSDDVPENNIHPDAGHVVSIEKLPDPEPEWQPGDVVLDDDGVLFVRRASSTDKVWHFVGRHMTGFLKDEEVARPLTLLVRDGKPVTA